MPLGIYLHHYDNLNLNRIAESIKSFRVNFSFFVSFIINFSMCRACIIWCFAVFTLENRFSFCLVLCTTPSMIYIYTYIYIYIKCLIFICYYGTIWLIFANTMLSFFQFPYFLIFSSETAVSKLVNFCSFFLLLFYEKSPSLITLLAMSNLNMLFV